MRLNSHRTEHTINLQVVGAHLNVTNFFDEINRPEVHINTESDDNAIVVRMDGRLIVNRADCAEIRS